MKTDRVDSELLAHLTRMDWLPTCYVPSREFRWLRGLLRHRAFRRKVSTAVVNRCWSELRKRGAVLDVRLVEVEALLRRRYGGLKPIRLLMTIPGIGFISALTIYAEICDIKRFPSRARSTIAYPALTSTPRISLHKRAIIANHDEV